MKAKFTGHDTFPLRHGWLFKAFKLIENKGLLTTTDSDHAMQTISQLGVGKNMVNAIKYWSEAAKVIETKVVNRNVVQSVSPIGLYLFKEVGGRDPFLENIGTIWLLHFILNFDDEHLTAYRYFFNYAHLIYFEKTKLVEELAEETVRLTGSDIGKIATVKKDVDCFLATYIEKSRSKAKRSSVDEDYFTSPLSELNLIRDLGRGFYQCDLDERPSLPLNVFMYALVRYFTFANAESQSRQVSFEDILSKPLSPGRIFRLSESELGRLLDDSVTESNGSITWVDSLGLKQVSIDESLLSRPMDLLDDYYNRLER